MELEAWRLDLNHVWFDLHLHELSPSPLPTITENKLG